MSKAAILGTLMAVCIASSAAVSQTTYTLTLQEYITAPINYSGGGWAIQSLVDSGQIVSCTPAPVTVVADATYTVTCTVVAGSQLTIEAGPLQMGKSFGPGPQCKYAKFTNFAGTGAGSYSGSSSMGNIVVNNNITEYGHWGCVY